MDQPVYCSCSSHWALKNLFPLRKRKVAGYHDTASLIKMGKLLCNDQLFGYGGSDYLKADEGGDDLLVGGPGSGALMSGDGDDVLFADVGRSLAESKDDLPLFQRI